MHIHIYEYICMAGRVGWRPGGRPGSWAGSGAGGHRAAKRIRYDFVGLLIKSHADLHIKTLVWHTNTRRSPELCPLSKSHMVSPTGMSFAGSNKRISRSLVPFLKRSAHSGFMIRPHLRESSLLRPQIYTLN